MKNFFVAVGSLLLFATPLLGQNQVTTPAPNPAALAGAAAAQAAAMKAKAKPAVKDEEGVKKSFADVAEAWASGDAKAVAEHFTEDSTYMNGMGVKSQGRVEVAKALAAELEGPMKGSQQVFDDFSFVWVMPNFVLVDCTDTMTGMKKSDGTDAGPMKLHVYGVIVNRGKGWQARAIRTYALMAAPGAQTEASAEPTATPAASTSATPSATTTVPAKKTNKLFNMKEMKGSDNSNP